MKEQQHIPIHYQKSFRKNLQNDNVDAIDPAIYLPLWRHPIVGYPAGLLLILTSTLIGFLEAYIQISLTFPGMLFLGSVIIVALIWGWGPALFSILLGILALDYLYIPPFGTLGIHTLDGSSQLLIFSISGGGITILAHRYEIAFRRLLAINRERLVQGDEQIQRNERDLDEAYTQIRSLLSFVTNELTTPLTTIRGNLKLARFKVTSILHAEHASADMSTQLMPLQLFLEQATHTLDIVNGQLHDLGDIALLQAHRLPLQCVPCNLTDIVRGAIDEQRQHTPEQDIHLELPALEAEQQAMQVKADPERIHQVIHYYLILNISAL